MDVAYETLGSGPPVLLVSGLAQTGARWRRISERLAKPAAGHPLGGDPRTFTVVTADNRETGGTGPCPDPFTLTDIAGDLLALMDRLRHHRFFLAGISMGGMIAQETAVLAPDRVRACVLLATHGGTPSSIPPPDPGILMAPHPRELWSRLAGPGFASAHADVIEEEADLSLAAATPLEGIMRQIQAIATFDPGDAFAKAVHEHHIPVAVGHGNHDPLVPYENGVRLAGRLGVDLVTYDGAGHGLEFERPDDVAALLRRTFTT